MTRTRGERSQTEKNKTKQNKTKKYNGMPKWCVETFCFIFITTLVPQLGSLQQSYWQLWHVAPLHGIHRTAKKGSYFPKIANAIIAKCTGWESWTLKVENQWEVQVGQLAWSRAYEHEIFFKFQTEICRNLLRIEIDLREDNKKATPSNSKTQGLRLRRYNTISQ